MYCILNIVFVSPLGNFHVSHLGKRKIILQNTFGKGYMLFHVISKAGTPPKCKSVVFFFPPSALRLQIPPNRVGLMVSITSPCHRIGSGKSLSWDISDISPPKTNMATQNHHAQCEIHLHYRFFFHCHVSFRVCSMKILELYHILYHYHVCFRICSEGDPMLLSFWMGFSNPSRCVIQVLLLS